MDKIEKPSDELNHFISRVCISPGHAAGFTGLDKLYHFSSVTIRIFKRIGLNFNYLLLVYKPTFSVVFLLKQRNELFKSA